jgi:hypothetical protein
MSRLTTRRPSLWNGRKLSDFYVTPTLGPHPKFAPGPRSNRAHGHIIRRRLACALRCRGLGRIPPAWLIEDYFLLPDRDTLNIFHIAADKGFLDRIPSRLLTQQNLQVPSYDEWLCSFYRAARHGHLHQIPRHLLTQRNLQSADWGGTTVFHQAVIHGQLNLISEELLTEETLLMPNDDGLTAIHFAARYGYLDQIPANIRTHKNLMLKSKRNGYTAFHYAALRENLDKIPPELLVPEAVLDEDAEGGNVVSYASEVCQLASIPITSELANRMEDVSGAIMKTLFYPDTDIEPRRTRQEMILAARAWQAKLARLALTGTQRPQTTPHESSLRRSN